MMKNNEYPKLEDDIATVISDLGAPDILAVYDLEGNLIQEEYNNE
jgi:hypothetical protein